MGLCMINCISIKTLGFLEEKLSAFLEARMDIQSSSESSKIVGNFSFETAFGLHQKKCRAIKAPIISLEHGKNIKTARQARTIL